MPLWEYKILSSKQTPFSHPGLLESFLNALGKDQWEIVSWRTAPENSLEFEALARRPAFKEWYLEGQVPPPPPAPRAEARPRKDADIREIVLPENAAGEEDESIWEEEDDEMPENVFAAVRPFLKRNPQNNVLSGSLEVLAGKFGVDERELLRAFEEEGMPPVPAVGQRTDPIEHDGMMFWINRNQRGQTWINARPKGRERPPQVATPEASTEGADAPDAPAEVSSEDAVSGSDSAPTQSAPVQASHSDEPQRERTLLDRVRPMMRRNKRGSGFSGSVDYLCRALKMAPEAFIAEIEALGLKVPATAEERLDAVAIGRNEWYFNKASNGQIWINGRERRNRDQRQDNQAAPAAEVAPATAEGTAPTEGSEATSAPVSAEAPAQATEGVSPAETSAPVASEVAPAAVEPVAPVVVSVEAPAAVVSAAESAAPTEAGEVVEVDGEADAEGDASDSSDTSQANEAEAGFLDQVREHLKRAKRGAPLSSELTPLAGILGTDTIAVIERLVRCGLDLPGDSGTGRHVEWAGNLYWIERNEEGNLALVSKEKARKSRARTSRSRK